MTKKQVIIVGASGHAKVIIDVFERMGNYEILGLFDDHIATGTALLGYQLLGNLEQVPPFLSKHKGVQLFMAIGDNWTRYQVKAALERASDDIQWAQAIHPFSHVGKGTKLGSGIAILAGAVINSEAEIKDFTIVGSNASIDHESHLGDYASLGPGSTLGGNVHIGDFSAIGLGANLIHGLTIGSQTVIGAGSLILQDFGNNLVVYGTPGKKIRTREEGEKYL